MPLVTCPDCGKQVSTSAHACPHCGRPFSSSPASTPASARRKDSSGCLAWFGVFLIVALGLIFFKLVQPVMVQMQQNAAPPKDSPAASPNGLPDGNPGEQGALKIANWTWEKNDFHQMKATFVVTNGLGHDVKDIEFTCTHYGKSGTAIDRNVRTVYEVLKAGTQRSFTIDMGLINTQSDTSSAKITDFKTAP